MKRLVPKEKWYSYNFCSFCGRYIKLEVIAIIYGVGGIKYYYGNKCWLCKKHVGGE